MRKLWLLALAAVLVGCDSHPKIGSIEIVPEDTLLVEGAQTQLQVTAFDENGRDLGPPNWTEVFWSSSGQGLQLGADGWVKAVGFGESTVTAQVEEFTATATIRSNPLYELTSHSAYINQVNQNPERPIPLVAGRNGLFRLFLVIDEDHYYEVAPDMRVQFDPVGIDTILTMEAGLIPRGFREDDLAYSYNMVMPKETIVPGLRARVTYDPNSEIHGLSGEEEVLFEVNDLPVHRQTIVPFISTKHPRPPVNNWTRALQTPGHREARHMRLFLPVNEDRIKLTIHETVETDQDLRRGFIAWRAWLGELELIYIVEGAEGHYYGVQRLPDTTGTKGVAFYRGSRVGVGGALGDTFAHEMGHTMTLRHAPCNVNNPDRDFPHRDGSIGFWGYDPERNVLVSSSHSDFMGYCGNDWVSAYHFAKALRFRNRIGGDRMPEEPVIVLWGDIGDERFEPAFRLTARPTAEDPRGRYLAEGFGANGERVFTHRFEPSVMGEYNRQMFALAIPDDGTPLASVTISGPGMAMTLIDGAVPPVMIEIDSQGRVRAIRRHDLDFVNYSSNRFISTGLPHIN